VTNLDFVELLLKKVPIQMPRIIGNIPLMHTSSRMLPVRPNFTELAYRRQYQLELERPSQSRFVPCRSLFAREPGPDNLDRSKTNSSSSSGAEIEEMLVVERGAADIGIINSE
jgi:hypothetical protein